MLIIISFELYWVHPAWNFREECSIHKSLVIYNQKIIKPGVINRRLQQIPKHAKKKNPSSSFLSIIILNFTFFKAINSSYQFNMCSVSELSIHLINITPIYLFTYLKSVYVYFFAWYCDKISRFPPTPHLPKCYSGEKSSRAQSRQATETQDCHSREVKKQRGPKLVCSWLSSSHRS